MKSTVLEENLDDNYEPTTQEIHEYARFLGMDPVEDEDLLWIAKESLKAPLPENWKPCQTEEGDIYYFNFKTGESLWDHPCDNHYRELFKKEKNKKSRNGSTHSKEILGATKILNSTLGPIISARSSANDSQRKTIDNDSLPAITSLHHNLKDLNQEEKKLAGLLKLKSNTSISVLSPIKVKEVPGEKENMFKADLGKEETLGKELEQLKQENSLEIQKIKDKHLEAKRDLESVQEKELQSLREDLEKRKLDLKKRSEEECVDFDLEGKKNRLSSTQEYELQDFERNLKEKFETEKQKMLLEYERELKGQLELEKRDVKEKFEAEKKELKEKFEYEKKDMKEQFEAEKKDMKEQFEAEKKELKEKFEAEERELKENLETEKKKQLKNHEKTAQDESEQCEETLRNTINESLRVESKKNQSQKSNSFDELLNNCNQILDHQKIYSTDLTELSQKKTDDDEFIQQLKLKLSNYTSYASKSIGNSFKSPESLEVSSIIENKNQATKISLIERNDSAILEYLKKVKERNFLDASTLSRHVLPDQIRKKTDYISSRSKWMAEIQHQEEYLRKF